MRLAQIWRYPVKSVGRQSLDGVTLARGECLPFDRHWAVIHAEATRHLGPDGLGRWLPKAAFLRGAAGPGLQAIEGGLADGRLKLSHPERGEISIDPLEAAERDRLIAWLAPLWPEDKPDPAQLVSGPDPLTDSRKAGVSINSLDSLHALEARVGRRLGVERFRGNLWIEGAEPFAELDWVGRQLTIGAATLKITDRIGRCPATCVDTETGQPDFDLVRRLSDLLGHSDFGVYAEVVSGGDIEILDDVTMIPETEPAA